MSSKSNPAPAAAQGYPHVRHDGIEDRKAEKYRMISLCAMIFMSIASPILYESSLLAWSIDILSTLSLIVAVVRLHPEEIKKFGPIVFPTAGLPLVVLFATRVSLLEIMPWMPLAISMWLGITVYYCPAMVSMIQEVLQGSRLDSFKSRRYISNDSRDVERDPDQAPDFYLKQNNHPRSLSQLARSHDLAFMGPSSSTISTTSSDIDLDEGNIIGKFVAARFLSHFQEDKSTMDFLDEVRFHSRDKDIHNPETPEDSLIGHHSRAGSTIHDHT